MIAPLQIKHYLHESIDLMQSLFCAGQDQTHERRADDFLAIKYTPKEKMLVDQSHIVWDLAVRRKIPVVWFLRTNGLVMTLTWTTCNQAGVWPEKLCRGDLSDLDFERLTETVSLLSGSPLQMCDGVKTDYFKNMLPTLTENNEFTSVLCDWRLVGDELAFAEKTARESKVTFLCPA